MKVFLVLVVSIFFVATTFGQKSNSKQIIVTKYLKKVPTGKKWTVSVGTPTRIQISNGVLKSGTFCNAMFLSNPKMVFNINLGDIYKSEGFSIVFKHPKKVPYTNDYTYDITPISFVDKIFSLSDFQYITPEEVGSKKLTFKAGETVFVSNCLESIEMTETNLTTQELLEENTKVKEEIKTNADKAKNFSIPITSDLRRPSIKPLLKDSLFDYAIFESPAVIFKKRNQRGGVDEVHRWTITLTQNKLELRTSGINETYTVLSAKYDHQLGYQEFQLADENGKFSHVLDLAYNTDLKAYSVLFNSNDFKDEYQFQVVTLKEIKYQYSKR